VERDGRPQPGKDLQSQQKTNIAIRQALESKTCRIKTLRINGFSDEKPVRKVALKHNNFVNFAGNIHFWSYQNSLATEMLSLFPNTQN
jgi:hypothetical protein